MRFFGKWLSVFLGLTVVTAGAYAHKADYAMTGVTIIDVRDGSLHPNQTIFVDDGVITTIEPTSDTPSHDAKTFIDHTGKFAIPALWDMHVHFRGEGLERENELFLSHFTGFGITGVRDAAGDLPEAVTKWRDEVNAGSRKGPRIFTSLQKLDGPNAAWPGSIALETPEDIVPARNTLKAGNPDFIKVYDSRLNHELYLLTLKAIENNGFKSAAHMPFAVAFRDAVNAGLDSIEHALYLHKAASPEDGDAAAALVRGERGNGVVGRLLGSYDETYFKETLNLMKNKGMAVTATLYVDHLLRFFDENDHATDARLSIIPEGIIKTYEGRITRAKARSAERIEADHTRMNATLSLMPMVAESGVMILAGSDTGAFNSYVYPGDSLHQEMQLMVEAGVPALTALQAATVNGAKWLGQSGKHGTLEVGKVADILILSANPLVDINNTRAIEGMLQGGFYYTGEGLEALRNKKLDD